MRIKLFNKTFKITPMEIGVLVASLLLVIALIIALVVSPSNTKEEPDATATAASKEPYDASKGVIDEKEFDGTILPKTEDEGEEYLKSTLFLGDSNTARFLKMLNEDNKTFTDVDNTIGVVGMGIDAISSLACMDFTSGRYTMPQAVKILQPERVIITFGTNNLSGNSTDASYFIERYEAQLKEIEKAYPSVDLIVNAIPPVSEYNHYPNIYMQQVDAYNRAIVKMCEKNDWKFLNSAEALKDSKSGYAKSGYMVEDGIHFSQKGLIALFEYIRTHAYITDDDRPKPLAAIPTVIGVPDGLIQINPLSNQEFTEEELEVNLETAIPTATPTPEETATPAPTAAPTATPECGENAIYSTTYNACVCLDGYEGNPAKGYGCTLSTPIPEATPMCQDPAALNNGDMANPCVYPTPVATPVCQDPNALNNGDMANPCVYPTPVPEVTPEPTAEATPAEATTTP